MGLLSLWTLALALSSASAIHLTVNQGRGNASSPLLYGLMFEDINHSGDGTLYGQLLQNNGFQGTNPGLTAWSPVGSARISQDTLSPLSSAIVSTLSIRASGSGTVGASNAGYSGIRVIKDTYSNYFWVKGKYTGSVTVSIVGSDGTVYGSTSVSISSSSSTFTYYETTIKANGASGGGNSWHFTFDAAKATDGGLNLGLPQLFPTTFKQRYNGLNAEVGNAVNNIGGSFLRMPGGNNIEGTSNADRWVWNHTIGPVQNRPGRQGDWGYPNTDGLGLVEFLLWCQDMNLTPILAIWDGLTVGGGSTYGRALKPYVQDVLNELEYLMGDTDTYWGALRASYGHPDPFDIPFVEIGNEDFLNNGLPTYQERFNMFYDAIHAAYPNITIIASTSAAAETGCSKNCGISVPAGVIQDVHQYLPPDAFVTNFNFFDNWPRNQPLFVGEYASTTDNTGARYQYPTMQGSVSEAVYMIGLERNSDVVKMACYAPMLEHAGLQQWTPDLIGFDAAHGVTRSTSYFVQQMFASNRGDTILPVRADAPFGPVYWVASSAGSRTIAKLANYGAAAQMVTVAVAGKTTASVTQISGQAAESNTPGRENVVSHTWDISGRNGVFEISLPAWSVSVLVAR
ncbi:hypothetical protein MBLNU459_g8522t1 [Dothideomycetes sp. NU459]